METYVRRVYRKKKDDRHAEGTPQYPFWDFRSRRGLNTSLPSNGGSSGSSMNSTRSECEFDDSSHYSLGSDVSTTSDPFRLTMEVLEYEENIGQLWDLLQPMFETVDSDLKLLNIAERSKDGDGTFGYSTSANVGRPKSCMSWLNRDAKIRRSFRISKGKQKHKSVDLNKSQNATDFVDLNIAMNNGRIGSGRESRDKQTDNSYGNCLDMSVNLALSVLLFLREDDEFGTDSSFQSARQYLNKSPWMYHHSDAIPNGLYEAHPDNNTDYYVINNDLPLWSIRQIHCGKEHVRFQLSSTKQNWEDNLEFYKRIIGSEPDLQRSNFCLFTLYSQPSHDVQFALKKLSSDSVTVKPTDCCRLQFRVTDIGRLVPLFPNVCTPISDTRWRTTDHDGNHVIVQTVGNRNYRSSNNNSFSSGGDSTSLLGFYV